MKVTAVIQSRVESTRLPSKALLPLAGKPLTYHVIERLKAVPSIDTVVLATGDGAVNEPLREIAASAGAEYFTGPTENVLERYCLVAEKFGGDYIVRATGDNPFTDPRFTETAVSEAVNSCADLFSISGLPLGIAVEVIKREALFAARTSGTMPHQQEHVSPYIKENPHLFKIIRRESGMPSDRASLRLTVDTEDDYRLAAIIYSALYRGTPFSLDEIFAFLDANPQYKNINSHVKQRPMTHSASSG
jgi:spore coat polysaccharide biosynthesis protein SpsF